MQSLQNLSSEIEAIYVPSNNMNTSDSLFLSLLQEPSFYQSTPGKNPSINAKWVDFPIEAPSPNLYQELVFLGITESITLTEILKQTLPFISIVFILGAVELLRGKLADASIAFAGGFILSLMVLYAALRRG